jgi:hypothetical protein
VPATRVTCSNIPFFQCGVFVLLKVCLISVEIY